MTSSTRATFWQFLYRILFVCVFLSSFLFSFGFFSFSGLPRSFLGT